MRGKFRGLANPASGGDDINGAPGVDAFMTSTALLPDTARFLGDRVKATPVANTVAEAAPVSIVATLTIAEAATEAALSSFEALSATPANTNAPGRKAWSPAARVLPWNVETGEAGRDARSRVPSSCAPLGVAITAPASFRAARWMRWRREWLHGEAAGAGRRMRPAND